MFQIVAKSNLESVLVDASSIKFKFLALSARRVSKGRLDQLGDFGDVGFCAYARRRVSVNQSIQGLIEHLPMVERFAVNVGFPLVLAPHKADQRVVFAKRRNCIVNTHAALVLRLVLPHCSGKLRKTSFLTHDITPALYCAALWRFSCDIIAVFGGKTRH